MTGKTNQNPVQFSLILIFSILMLSNAAINIKSIAESYSATQWPVKQASVLSSMVFIGCGQGKAFFPKVYYRYTVGKETYTGNQLATEAIGCGTWEAANAITDQYKLGDTIKIHVSPTSPQESVILPGEVADDTWASLVISLIGLFTCLFSVTSFQQFHMVKKRFLRI
ncbi:MAG: DUF3592 domain-containing protein [Pseudomonadota bacterium]